MGRPDGQAHPEPLVGRRHAWMERRNNKVNKAIGVLACFVLPTILRCPCKGRRELLKHDPSGLGRSPCPNGALMQRWQNYFLSCPGAVDPSAVAGANLPIRTHHSRLQSWG